MVILYYICMLMFLIHRAGGEVFSARANLDNNLEIELVQGITSLG